MPRMRQITACDPREPTAAGRGSTLVWCEKFELDPNQTREARERKWDRRRSMAREKVSSTAHCQFAVHVRLILKSRFQRIGHVGRPSSHSTLSETKGHKLSGFIIYRSHICKNIVWRPVCYRAPVSLTTSRHTRSRPRDYRTEMAT